MVKVEQYMITTEKENFEQQTSLTCIGSYLRLRRSHILTVPSTDPDKITVDSSLKTTQFTRAAWPRNLRSASPVLTFHSITDLSKPQEPMSLKYRLFLLVAHKVDKFGPT